MLLPVSALSATGQGSGGGAVFVESVKSVSSLHFG